MRKIPPDLQNLFQLIFRGDHNSLGFRIAEDVFNIGRRAGRVERNGDGAEPQGGEVRDEPLQTIFREQSEAVTLRKALCAEPQGEG